MEMIISYMEQHTLFALNQITKLGPKGHDKYENMWKKLTVALNNCNGVRKDPKA